MVVLGGIAIGVVASLLGVEFGGGVDNDVPTIEMPTE